MTTDELKSALLDRDFDKAQSLINAWGASIRRAIKAAPGDAERYRILEDAQAFAEQHLYLARVVRAHIATELQANSASFLYASAELEQPRWRFRG